MIRRLSTRIFALFVLLTAITAVFYWQRPAAQAASIAPGCTAARPTAIGGSIYGFGGQFNNWALRSQVNVDLEGANSQKLNIDGTPRNTSAYSATENINVSLAMPGAASGYDRTWGDDLTINGVEHQKLCVSSKVKVAFIEVYPKDLSGKTDKVYYGLASSHGNPITAGVMNTIGLRLPVGQEYGGNSGDYNGYITYRGDAIPDPANNVNFRTWPTDGGPACGVQGLAVSAQITGTYYLVKHMAGGQCGATYQRYKIDVSCKNVCGSSTKKITKYVDIKGGNARPRVDFQF